MFMFCFVLQPEIKYTETGQNEPSYHVQPYVDYIGPWNKVKLMWLVNTKEQLFQKRRNLVAAAFDLIKPVSGIEYNWNNNGFFTLIALKCISMDTIC